MGNNSLHRLLLTLLLLNFWLSANEADRDAGIHNTEKLSFQVELFAEGFDESIQAQKIAKKFDATFKIVYMQSAFEMLFLLY